MKKKEAISIFRSGYNCAQSVFSVYANELSFDKDLALSVSCGFGAGMGKLQKTCGAVTGAYMALGIYNSNKLIDNAKRKEATNKMIQNFNREFVTTYGSTDCIALLECDLNTPEGQQYAEKNNLYETHCESYIKKAIETIDDLLEN